MTVVNAPPVTVAPSSAGDASFPVPIPAAAPMQVGWALVVNQSAYTLEISQGAPLGWLPAGISNAYPLNGSGTPVTLTIPAGTAPAPTGLPAQVVYVTYSDTPPPGQWPAGVNTAQLSAAVSTALEVANFNIGSFTVPDTAAAAVNKSFPIPANTHSIKAFAVQTSGAASATAQLGITGDQSGETYLNAVQLNFDVGGPANQPYAIPIIVPFAGSGMDTSVTFEWSNPNTGFGGWTVYVMGSSDPANVLATITNRPVYTDPNHPADHYASSFQGGNTVHQLVAGALGLTVRIYSAWCALCPSGAAPGGSFGCFITKASTGDIFARAQIPNAVIGDRDSNTFPAGLLVPLTAGDAINLTTDNAGIFGWGGIAYALA